MTGIFLLVAILVNPFIVSNGRNHEDEDNTEPDAKFDNTTDEGVEINEVWEIIKPTKRPLISERKSWLFCGRRSPLLEIRKRNVEEFPEDEKVDFVVHRTIMEKITGGRNEIYSEVPWHANLVYKDPRNNKLYRFCNGAVYNHLWIITTARCASFFSHHKISDTLRTVPDIWVFVGDHLSDIVDEGEQQFEIKQYLIHPSFEQFPFEPLNGNRLEISKFLPIGRLDNGSKCVIPIYNRVCFQNKARDGRGVVALTSDHRDDVVKADAIVLKKADFDIAILKVDGFINMQQFVQPICLVQRGEFIVKVSSVLISGMGERPRGSNAHSQMVRLMTARPNRCQYPDFRKYSIDCLEDTNGATICDGDNGAPAATKVGKNWILLGLIGFIDPKGCTPTQTPPYMINMNFYYYWVYWNVLQDAGDPSMIPERRT